MIEEKWEEAAEKYREAIRVIEEHKGQIKTDTLQRLHTLTNLAEVIEAGHEGRRKKTIVFSCDNFFYFIQVSSPLFETPA